MKKVLIISYYWPPCGGIGVLRCLKIAKYLREFGWEPIVFTAENAHYPTLDPDNFNDVPEGMLTLKHPIFEPYSFYKKLTGQPADANVNNALVAGGNRKSFLHKLSVFIRSNFFIPDARGFWVNPSVKYLTRYLKENPVDALFSDGPPHSNTLIACRLKQALGLPWLADFQDPWTQVDYFKKLILTPWANRKHHRLEQEVFKTADQITIVSQQWKKDLEGIGANNVSVIPWGYDEADYEHLVRTADQKLTITHAGLIGEDRLPQGLFKAVSEMVAERPEYRKWIEIRLLGQVDDMLAQLATDLGIGDLVKYVGQVNRKEALQASINTQLLLLLLNKAENAMGRIPGKLFEYLAVRRPILCLGPEGSDVDQILKETQSGSTFDYTATSNIKAFLMEQMDSFLKNGDLPLTVGDIERYKSYHLTGQMAQLLNTITA